MTNSAYLAQFKDILSGYVFSWFALDKSRSLWMPRFFTLLENLISNISCMYDSRRDFVASSNYPARICFQHTFHYALVIFFSTDIHKDPDNPKTTRLRDGSSVFNAELEGILLALKKFLTLSQPKNFIIYTDSLSGSGKPAEQDFLKLKMWNAFTIFLNRYHRRPSWS